MLNSSESTTIYLLERVNCIKLINQGRYIQSQQSSEKVSPSSSMSRSVYDFTNLKNNNRKPTLIPNINVENFNFKHLF